MFRRGVFVPLAVVAFLQLAESASRAADDSVPVVRIRPSQPTIAALIEQGVAQSKTFKSLVSAIDRTDGIVYVSEGKCGHGVRACLVPTLTVAGPYRILRILIDPREAERRLIANIGHELRHALEVLDEPAVRSNAQVFHLFARIGITGGRTIFETPDAVRAGIDVYNELGPDK
jgi:hypothetical protein